MSLFSFLRKNKQESPDDTPFVSRAEGESNARRSRTRKQGAADVKDPALPEKKRARRRLIGAVALVLAAIIGLPMILDSEPKPLTDDVAIRIPSKDKPAQLQAQPAPVVPPPASGLAASTTLDPNEEVVEPPLQAPAASRAAPVATTPAPAKDAAKDTAKDSHAAKTPVAEKPQAPLAKSENKPAPKADKADDSRALALLEGKSDPKPAEKKAGKFVIQVAALASKEKVNEVQTRLKDAGIKSYTQKVATDSGERIRIRVGPFANKDEADKIKAKIVKLGLGGTLVPA